MTARRKTLTAEDRRLWREVVSSVKPLRGTILHPEPLVVDTEIHAVPPPPPKQSTTSASPPSPAAALPNPPGRVVGRLDDRTTRDLKKGRLRIDSRIDLHGMNEAHAHAQLLAHLRHSRIAGLRMVLVITGKGASSGGILRNAVPKWFETPPFNLLVSAWRPAEAAHGGDGALYVRIRREQVSRSGGKGGSKPA